MESQQKVKPPQKSNQAPGDVSDAKMTPTGLFEENQHVGHRRRRRAYLAALLLVAVLLAIVLLCSIVPSPVPPIVKQTVIVTQPVTVEVVKYVTMTVPIPVPQTVEVLQTVTFPQTVLVEVPVTQTVIQTVPVIQTVVVTRSPCMPPATTPTPPAGTDEFLSNGRFEQGFGIDGVPTGWFAFNNGGEHVMFSYHDDMWYPVAIDCNSALVEIDTRQFSDTVPDRFSGIGQTVSGLQAGGQYQMTLTGEMRTTDGDRHTDDQSYYAEWGIDPDGGTDWRNVSHWNTIPWSHAYYYSSAISLGDCSSCSYGFAFAAPSSKVTLFVRLYKRWALPAHELLLNLANVSLVGPR